jgi:transposase
MVQHMPKPSNTQTRDWRELRRLRAWSLYQESWSQTRIAEEVGVSQGAVSRWFKQVRDGGGVDALRRHPAPGKRALLTKEQFAQIPELMHLGAEAFGFQGNHWTTKRVAIVLKQVFGITYHPGHISRVLKKHCPEWRNQKKA